MKNRFRKVSADMEEFDLLIQKAKDLIFQEERVMKALDEGWGDFEAIQEGSSSSEGGNIYEKKARLQDIGNREFLDVLKEIVVSASDTFPRRYKQFETDSYNYITTLWEMFSASIKADTYRRYIDELDVRIRHTQDHIAFMKTWIEVNKEGGPDDPRHGIGMDTSLENHVLASEKKVESMIIEKEKWKKEKNDANKEFFKIEVELNGMMFRFQEKYSHQ